MSIVYSNVPFFYSEALPDFKGAYGKLENIPLFDTYIWKDEETPQPTGEQKHLEEFEGIVEEAYCVISESESSKGFHKGDIVKQTIEAKTPLDLSRDKLEEPLLYTIGEEFFYAGKTGNLVKAELREKWGDNITFVAEGSGVMSQTVDYIVVTDDAGNRIDHFRKGERITVNLDLHALPTPKPEEKSSSSEYSGGSGDSGGSGYSGGSGHSGGGGSSGGGSSMNAGR